MPAAWIGAGSAAIGAVDSLTGGGGSSSAGQAASGAANIAGGALSYQEAQQFANQVSQTANPFGQYNQQFGQQLAGAANAGTYGNASPGYLQNLNNLTGGASNTLAQTSASQLTNLLNNPSSIYDTAQYKSAFGQGQNAVNSTLAAQGLNGSGNQLAALQSYGQTFGEQQYNTTLSQLSGLFGQSYGQLASGAGINQSANQQGFNQLALLSGASTGSPATAAAAQAQVYSNAGQAGTSIGTGIGQLANGLSGLANGSPGSNGFSTGLGTTSGVGTNQGYDSGVYGVGGGVGDSGYTYSGGNSWGFTE